MSDISPEEKLLRLIRNNKKAASAPSARHTVLLTSGFFLKIRRWVNVRFFLYLIMGLAFIYWVYAFFIDAALTERMSAAVAQKLSKESAPALTPGAQEKPLDYYMEGLKNSPVFKEGVQESAASGTEERMDPELVKNLNLIGVISGEIPEAAIEDKKAQKTHQVQQGQFVGEFQVEKITSNKVTLNYKGRRYDLTL